MSKMSAVVRFLFLLTTPAPIPVFEDGDEVNNRVRVRATRAASGDGENAETLAPLAHARPRDIDLVTTIRRVDLTIVFVCIFYLATDSCEILERREQ